MTDFPRPDQAPLFVNSLMPGYTACGEGVNSPTTWQPAAAGWPAANLAIYIPFSIPWPYPVNRVYWGNGTTLSNMAFGIYTIGGTKIYATASTAQSGASAIQYVTPTAFLLSPGRYYMALICDSATTLKCWATTITAIDGRLDGLLEQAVGSMTLPATMTGAQFTRLVYPLCGITRTTAGF